MNNKIVDNNGTSGKNKKLSPLETKKKIVRPVTSEIISLPIIFLENCRKNDR